MRSVRFYEESTSMTARAMRIGTLLVMGGAALWLVACAAGAGRQIADPCETTDDCPAGTTCIDNFCVHNSDGGTPPDGFVLPDGYVLPDGSTAGPLIFVTPLNLGFSQASQGSPETHTVTVVNVGQATLEITNVELTENDTTPEYTFSGPTASLLENSESATLDVTLSPTDTNPDEGQLLIWSNDPGNPVVAVALLPEFTCTPTGAEVCDGVDNDCDGSVDLITENCYDAGDGGCNPDGTNCQGICQGGTRTCTNGTWSPCAGQVIGMTEICDALDNDCDGTVNNGIDEGGDQCASPASTISLSDSSCNTQIISGTIHQGDSDWHAVNFTSSGNNSTSFHARLEFVSPPGGGNYRMEIRLDNCSTPVECESGTHSGVTVFDWDIDSSALGRCPFDQSCNHTINARVRVYNDAATDCAPYTIQASNGC